MREIEIGIGIEIEIDIVRGVRALIVNHRNINKYAKVRRYQK